MNYEELISDANLAFAGNQFEVSLKKAQEAINKDDSKAEGYVCAGKAALSLGSAEMAEHYFKTATEKDKNNGNIFFLLGYAQAMSGHSSKAVQLNDPPKMVHRSTKLYPLPANQRALLL